MHDPVLIVGGGIIGLSIAWRLSSAGVPVEVLDAGTPGAWNVAAGMLAPVAEVEFGEPELLALGRDSLALWPAFAAALGVPLHEAGTLVVARDADEAAELERLQVFRERLGLPSTRLLATKARRVEPALASVRLALEIPDDHAVDPRTVVAALRARVPVVAGQVVAVTSDGGVTLADGSTRTAATVVLAAGAWSGQLLDGLPVRPVGGQVIRLTGDPGLVSRVIRTHEAYLVPRGDGHYVLGATMEERGFDTRPTAAGVFELIRDMSEVVPGILELEIEELCASVRPGTPDNRPLLGRVSDRLVLATGHHRNGVLLAPITAELIAGLITGEADPRLAPFSADRLVHA